MIPVKKPKFAGDLVTYYARHITPVEARMMLRFSDLRRFKPVTALMRLASRLGDGPLYYMTAIVLLTVGETQERAAAVAAAMAVVLSVVLFKAIKNLIGRPRPYEIWADLPCQMLPSDRFSFPSGHTMTAFAVCGAFAVLLPTILSFFLPAALLIGISRIFLGLHYPTDVLVGALLGATIGLTSAHIVLLQMT